MTDYTAASDNSDIPMHSSSSTDIPAGLSVESALIHAVAGSKKIGDPISPPTVLTSAFHLDTLHESEPYFYARNSSPSVETLEKALSALDASAETVVNASGMAAITTVFRALLSAGDTVIVPSDGYYWTRDYAQQNLARWGITVIALPTATLLQELSQLDVNPALILVETPSTANNPPC